MDHVVIQIAMRYLHIVSAILAVGGVSFLLMCLSPATRMLDDGFRESVLSMARNRFHRVLWLSIGGLVLSGVYNWVMLAATYKAMGPKGNALIGTKVLLALIMFAMVWAGSTGKVKLRVAQMVNVHLAAVVILLAVILRHFRLEYLTALANGG